MDLSFFRKGGLDPAHATPIGRPRVPVWPYLRAATAAEQAASPTARAMAGILRGQDSGGDWIQELAEIFAPRSGGVIEAVGRTGSFNPSMASRLGGGKVDEGRVYRGALADVQG
ncbi:hypothetical protein J3E64_001671 [Sphingobium sp. OAS761]|uniref:hypothetical protein n=1 Tax=Sphingobium sp. OAS761 TaxID=2817901 RepID=UPI00209CB008|nr:hypothetical protein [Sphingobium sp. OAS761]MCP1469984.1 hypothetical protein [Sphingobium sp. OAS761]